MTTPLEQMLDTLFGHQQSSELQQAKQKAAFNQPVIRQEVSHYSVNPNPKAPIAKIQDL